MKTKTVRGFRRLFVRYAAITFLTTSVLSVGIAGTASASTTTLTAVGTFVSASGTGLATASATLVNTDDLLVIWVQAQTESTAGQVTGITYSGAGAIGTAVNAIQYATGSGHPGNEDEIWYAPVTTTGAITLNFTWSGTMAGDFEYSTQEFHPSAASSYLVDSTGSLPDIASSTTVTFPTLTLAGAGELYAGYNSNSTTGSYSSPTSGYTVESGGTGDAVIFDPNTTGPQSPTAVAGSASTQSAIGATIIATADPTDTVSFNSEGGSAASSQSGPDASTITLPAAPTFAGHTFDGWFAASSGGSAFTSPYTLSGTTPTLYAQWTANATALTAVGSFASASGTGLATASATLVNTDDLLVIWVQAQSGSAAGQVTGITYSGAGAIGTAVHAIQYATGSGHPGNEDEIWYAPVTTVGAITLHFTWSGTTSSEFEYSTQEFQPSVSSSYSVDSTGNLPDIASSTTVAFPTLTPTDADELYAGYNSNSTSGSYGSATSGYTVESGGVAGVSGDAVIFDPNTTSLAQSPTAVATGGASTQSAIGALIFASAVATDTVSFNSEGGSAASSQSGPDGSTITLPAAPTYAGYSFNGWFAASSGGSALTSPYTLSGTTPTLYAQWTANATDTVNFNSEGGTAVGSQTGPNGSTITLPAAPTYAGYSFNGWFAASSGGSAFTSPYTLAGTTTTLYAQWTSSGGGGGGGGGGGAPVLGSLSISASSQNVTVGGVVAASTAAVSGLSAGDTATVVGTTFTFAGTGTTVYAASTTAPSAVGTYSVTPSAATVTISPSTDASKYSTSYTYVAGALVISPAIVVPPVLPHATRVIGHAVAGKTLIVRIIGSNFSNSPRVTSNELGASVRKRSGTSTQIVLVITVRKGIRPGSHRFTITTDTGKQCEIGYVSR